MRDFMVNKVIPAIHERWPDEGKIIYIQQDNAPSHVKSHDEDLLNAIALTGRDIRILQQPPNSPDMNVLDLGFFRSLQSFTDQLNPKTIDELIDRLEEDDYPSKRAAVLCAMTVFFSTRNPHKGIEFSLSSDNENSDPSIHVV